MCALKPKLGISIGDYNGIGPELILKTAPQLYTYCVPVLYAPSIIFDFYCAKFKLENCAYRVISKFEDLKPDCLNIFEIRTEELPEPGHSTFESSKIALLSLEKVVSALKLGYVDALLTAPINKHALQTAGFKHPGHTEYLADEFGGNSLMVMYSKKLIIATLTGHIPLKLVSDKITPKLITQKIRILDSMLRHDFQISKPRIAVLGCNPHAGENGSIGTEEIDFIEPTLHNLRQKGLDLTPCLAADGFFGLHQYHDYDAVLALYHDQGLIPFKTLALSEGVNYTAGLSIVRTSPAHGTAYDIAGKGSAHLGSFAAAARLAVEVFTKRNGGLKF